MPEVIFEETGIVTKNVLVEPNVHARFAVITIKGVDSILTGPYIHHLTNGVGEGISKNCSQIGSHNGR